MAEQLNPIPADVADVLFNYPEDVRDRLLFLRRLIFEVAAETEGVGQLEEALRWGQPSYLTTHSKSGSTIRIDADRAGKRYALYFNCRTILVETFREQHPTAFHYGGNRSIIFGLDDEIPVDALRHCIALALTYHRWK